MEFIINYATDNENDNENDDDNAISNSEMNNIQNMSEYVFEYVISNKTIGVSEQLISNEGILSLSNIMGGSTGLTGKENQDNYCFQVIKRIKKNNFVEVTDEIKIIIVCDGHGQYGKVYADIIVNKFSDVITENLHEIVMNPNDNSILKSLFIKFNKDEFYNKYKYINGGSTCTLIINTNEFIICANIGDCDAYIKYDTNDKLIQLSQNQSLQNESEIKRLYNIAPYINVRYHMRPFDPSIDKPEYRFAKEQLVWVRNEDGSLTYNDTTNQPRIYFNNMKKDFAMYIHNDKNGIKSNCSRSFGDFQNEYVTAEPDVNVIYHKCNSEENNSYKIITGSDGFFNCYTNEEFEQICLLDANDIINHGIQQVDKTFGKKYADNMTIIVLNGLIN